MTATYLISGQAIPEESDISFTNGAVSSFTDAGSNTYTFDFTASSEGVESSIFVPSNAFVDEFATPVG